MRKIDKGERICEEAPFLVMEAPQRQFTSDAANTAVLALPLGRRALVYTLHNADPRNPDLLYNILVSNGLSMDQNTMGLFLSLSRINHACNHNAHAAWNPNLHKLVVHAVRDIAKDEEICISYISKHGDLPLVREMRRAILMRQRKFLCVCDLCALPPDLADASDSRIHEAHFIHTCSELNTQAPVDRLQSNRKALELLGRDRVGCTYAPKLYASMALLCIASSDMARGRVFYSLAASAAKVLLGKKHPATQSYLQRSKNPSSHHMATTWTRWQSSVGEVPQEFASKRVFDDWLWRRGIDQIVEFPFKYADLADTNIVMPFKKLPFAREFDPNLFFFGPDGGKGIPLLRRSWVYVGEIVEVLTHPQITLKVRDISCQPGDEDGTVIFTDLDDGNSFFPSGPPSVGTTIGLAYPVRDALLDGTIAVSITIATEFAVNCRAFGCHFLMLTNFLVQIFPIDMEELMYVNEQVKKHASLHGGFHKCHKCGEPEAFLACDGCEMFYYCDGVSFE